MIDYRFQWPVVWAKLPALLDGAAMTLQITALSVLFGAVMGLVLMAGSMSTNRVAHSAAQAWIEVARNTPVLFQIYVAYFGLGELGIHMSSFTAVLSAISFNTAGYLAEVFRGGYASVPKAQMRSARSLGMTALQANLHVMLPQMLRSTWFPFINQVQWAMLSSSLGLIVGLRELTGATQFAQSQSFRTFEFFLVAAAIYYVLAKLLQLGAQIIYRLMLGKRA